jgi:RluA family pseudouridine synthase
LTRPVSCSTVLRGRTVMSDPIKLSSAATREFWEPPVLFEDEHLLALDKPARLLTSPDRHDPDRPSVTSLLHAGIARGVPWAKNRDLCYLMNAHRPDADTTGVLLLAKSKPVFVKLAGQFGSEKPSRLYAALVRGVAQEDTFECKGKVGHDPLHPGRMRLSEKTGKRSITQFKVRERFPAYTLLECRPLTDRTHQIRLHLRRLRLPVVGDRLYGASPLLLSSLKRDYRQKRDRPERPLIGRAALHLEELAFVHPVTEEHMVLRSDRPKDLAVAVKYLQRYAPGAMADPEGVES